MRWELIKEQKQFMTVRYYNPLSEDYLYITYIYDLDRVKKYLKDIKSKFNITKIFYLNKAERLACLKVVYRKIRWPYRTAYYNNYNRISYSRAKELWIFCID